MDITCICKARFEWRYDPPFKNSTTTTSGYIFNSVKEAYNKFLLINIGQEYFERDTLVYIYSKHLSPCQKFIEFEWIGSRRAIDYV